MIRQDIDVNGYWTIIVLYEVWLGYLNTGFTHTDFNKKRTITGISVSSSTNEFLNTVVHEAKHIQSHICKYYGIDEDSEDAAYLIGFIVSKMQSFFKSVI